MSWGEAGAGESQAKKEWRREAILCPWLTTETTQSAARPPVWHLGIKALLSPIYQTKAFSALQHRTFCRPRWYPQKKRWLKPPPLEDSAIQAGSQPAAVGFAPGNVLLFVLLWAGATFHFDYSCFFFWIFFFLICAYLPLFLRFVHQTGVLQHDLQSWSRGKGNMCVQCMWGALQVLKLFRHLCQPPQSDPCVLCLSWSVGRRKPDAFGVQTQVTVLTYLETCNRKTEACQGNSLTQDLLNSFLCAGGLACQTASLQAKGTSVCFSCSDQFQLPKLSFCPGIYARSCYIQS